MADPKEGQNGTGAPGPGTSPSGGSGPDVGVISIAEHSRAIEEERKRRAGQESKHQRDMLDLRAQIEELKQATGGRSTASLPADLEARLNSNDSTEVAQAVRDGVAAMHSWTTHLANEAQSQRARDTNQRQIADRLDQLQAEGIDVSKLRDATSVASIEVSLERYHSDKRIEDLQSKVDALSRGNQNVEDAVTQERNRNGSTQTATSTGTTPRPATTRQQQMEQLEEQIKQARRLHKGGDAIKFARELALLKSQAA